MLYFFALTLNIFIRTRVGYLVHTSRSDGGAMRQVGASDTKAELLPHRLGRTEDDDPPLYI